MFLVNNLTPIKTINETFNSLIMEIFGQHGSTWPSTQYSKEQMLNKLCTMVVYFMFLTMKDTKLTMHTVMIVNMSCMVNE